MDILKWFRKCFYCGKKDGLARVVRHTAYFTESYSYHEKCLKRVLCDPEAHMQYVDLALDIANAIEIKEAHGERQTEEAEKVCQRLF